LCLLFIFFLLFWVCLFFVVCVVVVGVVVVVEARNGLISKRIGFLMLFWAGFLSLIILVEAEFRVGQCTIF